MPKKMLQILSTLFFFLGLLLIANYSILKSEQKDCIKWERYEKEYPKFEYSNAMKEQCKIK